jgi:sulfide:quinone oxidoreductase
MTASHTAQLESRPKLGIVTLEATPLGLFGRGPSEAVAALLADNGIAFHGSTHPVAFHDGSLSVVPQGTLAADRVVALPQLRGNAPAGLPTDNEGFVPVDRVGRVRGEDRILAAGDVTAFPVKQGGIAAQQADAAAAAIAAEAGAPVTAEDFRPVLRGLLLTGTGARFFRTEVTGGHGDAAEVSRRLLWWPEMKVAGRYLSHYLSREVEPLRLPDPLPADAIPVELDLTETPSGV